MVLNYYLTYFLLFPWPINYNHAFQGTKFFTHSLLSWFWLKIFFLSLNSRCCTWLCLMGLKLHKWTKNCLESVLKFDTNPTPSWWKSWTTKNAPLFRSWTFSSLVLSNFSKLLYLGDFVASWPHFWQWT